MASELPLMERSIEPITFLYTSMDPTREHLLDVFTSQPVCDGLCKQKDYMIQCPRSAYILIQKNNLQTIFKVLHRKFSVFSCSVKSAFQSFHSPLALIHNLALTHQSFNV